MTTFTSAQTRLSYPVYAADFDPEDDRSLVVGGGGGEGRSGVSNHIVRALEGDWVGNAL